MQCSLAPLDIYKKIPAVLFSFQVTEKWAKVVSNHQMMHTEDHKLKEVQEIIFIQIKSC
jgi:hypothetical protein